MRPFSVLLTHKLIHRVAAAAAALGHLGMAVGATCLEVAAGACGAAAAVVSAPGVDLEQEEEAVGAAEAWVAFPRAASLVWTLAAAAWGRST